MSNSSRKSGPSTKKKAIVYGAGLGMIFGAAFGNAAIGMVLGAAFGLVLGPVLVHKFD